MKMKCTIAVTLLLACAASAPAVTVIQHLGATDPLTEGFSTVGDGISVTVGPVVNDLGTGIDAWSIDDPSTAFGSGLFYSAEPSAGDVANAAANGWSLTVRLRIIDPSENVDRGIFVEYVSDTTRFRMDFGSQADGDPIVLLQTGVSGGDDTGATTALEGAGDGYHVYQLRFDPVAGSADLFVDGVEEFSNYAGFADATNGPRVAFGAGQQVRRGHAHYSDLRFAIVPAPAALPAGLLGLAALAMRRR